MKKNLILVLLFTLMIVGLGSESVFANSNYNNFAYNYEFNTGIDYSEELGKPTQTDYVDMVEKDLNIRRNKDTSLIPPSYGIFSGNIDTAYSNPDVSI